MYTRFAIQVYFDVSAMHISVVNVCICRQDTFRAPRQTHPCAAARNGPEAGFFDDRLRRNHFSMRRNQFPGASHPFLRAAQSFPGCGTFISPSGATSSRVRRIHFSTRGNHFPVPRIHFSTRRNHFPVLRHRIVRSFHAEVESMNTNKLTRSCWSSERRTRYWCVIAHRSGI